MTSESMRSWLETREGQQLLSLVHGWTRAALEMTGAVRVGEAVVKLRGSSFPFARNVEPEDVVACFERLVELGELRELTVLVTVDADRVFIRASRVGDSVSWRASTPTLAEIGQAWPNVSAEQVERMQQPGDRQWVERDGGHDRRVKAAVAEGPSGYVRELLASPQSPPPRGPLTADERKYALETLCFRPPEGLTRADELVLKRLEWEDEQQGGGRDASTAQTGTPGDVLEHEPPQGDSWSGASVSDGEWKGWDS